MPDVIHIVGYGPSVASQDAIKFRESLRSEYVIALNYAFELLPDCDVIFFGNDSWFFSNWPELRRHPARLMRVLFPNAKRLGMGDVLEFENTGVTGIETEGGKLRHGKACGYAAINLAVQLGAKEIHLHGYDLKPGGKHARVDLTNFYPALIDRFSTMVEPLRGLGVKVLNRTPGSALRAFPCKT